MFESNEFFSRQIGPRSETADGEEEWLKHDTGQQLSSAV